MDSQGFAPSNLAPPKSGVPSRAPTRGDAGKSAIVTGNQVIHETPDTDSRVIGFFKGVQGATSALWMVQFIAMLPVAGLAWLFGKFGWQSGSFALKRWVQAPLNALFKTSVAEATSLPANMARSAADIARESANPKTNAKAVLLEGKAAEWQTRGDGWRASIAKFFAKMRSDVGKWLAGISENNWFAKQMKSFTEWRINKHTPKVEKTVQGILEGGHEGKGLQALIGEPARLAQEATEKALAPDAEKLAKAKRLAEVFEPVHTLLKQAMETKDPAARKALLEQAAVKTEAIVKTLTGADAKLAHGIRDGIQAAIKTATTLDHHVAALGAGLRGQVKNVMRMAGKIPVFYAIVGAGVAAGAVASALNAKRENKLAKQAVKDMADDIGDAKHPIVQQASRLEEKTKSRRWVSAGLNTIGDGAMLAPVNGMMGFAAVMGASQLPQVGQLIMPANQSLSAYMMLKKAENGSVKLEPQQKVEMLRHLVTAVPAFAKQGGVDNTLATPVAVEIAKREMSVRDTMRFLASPDAFMNLVTNVATEQKKINASTAPASSAIGAAPAAVAKPAAQTPTPALSIVAAKGTSQGRVVEPLRAVGQV